MAIKEINYNNKRFRISYTLNGKGKDSILFLHGWGSNKEIMKGAFGKYISLYKQIYIDMPGFGQSPNEEFLKTVDYANIINLFLKEIELEPKIIVGHSFGGKVATLLKPKCLILLSSAGILVPKPISVKLKITLSKLFKFMGISKISKIFIANDAKEMNSGMYETFKYVVNEEFEENFKKTDSQTYLFWGKSDTATPLWTAQKIEKLIKNSTLYPLDGDHFFFVNHAKFISQTIESKC